MSSHEDTNPSSMPASINGCPLDQSSTPKTRLSPDEKGTVVGLYGISGSGKTYILTQLKRELGNEFLLYEGSAIIAKLVPDGLEGFHKLCDQDKIQWRQHAIDTIKKECIDSGKTGVVAGHLMFWAEKEDEGRLVYTKNDLETYSHIFYLDVPPDVIAQRRSEDMKTKRPFMTTSHLLRWQQAEKTHLRRLCHDHGILFSLLAVDQTMGKISTLLNDIHRHNERYNLSLVEQRLDSILEPYQGTLETVLVLDADRTLAAVDTGRSFWNRHQKTQQWDGEGHPLKSLFGSAWGYSYAAFRQATLLYEETADDQTFEILCHEVASEVTMYPEFVSLLQKVDEKDHVGAIVVSCGIRRVWEMILQKHGLSEKVKVIAGGRIVDRFVVTAAVKAALVTRLRDTHNVHTWAFGDSPLDLEMLKVADQAVVVVGDEKIRSKSMDAALSTAIDQDGLQAFQVTLPSSASPRLNTTKLPLVRLSNPDFVASILRRRNGFDGLRIVHATEKNAAKLIATPMRDAATAGPMLRKAHRRAGWYLAHEFLLDVIGIEECPVTHVLGHNTTGHRLRYEQQTTIVALMRAGEPMADGVNDAFPLAMFVHAKRPEDIQSHHLKGKAQVILVDAVVNSGKTAMEFVETIRTIDANIHIVFVAGVVQAECVSPDSAIYKSLTDVGNISLIALRISDTKFTGSGTTDTGNRLFNTTHIL